MSNKFSSFMDMLENPTVYGGLNISLEEVMQNKIRDDELRKEIKSKIRKSEDKMLEVIKKDIERLFNNS